MVLHEAGSGLPRTGEVARYARSPGSGLGVWSPGKPRKGSTLVRAISRPARGNGAVAEPHARRQSTVLPRPRRRREWPSRSLAAMPPKRSVRATMSFCMVVSVYLRGATIHKDTAAARRRPSGALVSPPPAQILRAYASAGGGDAALFRRRKYAPLSCKVGNALFCVALSTHPRRVCRTRSWARVL